MNISTQAVTRQITATSGDKRVLMAGAIGQFIEFYDFAIYGFSVVIIAKLFFPQTDPVAGILAAFAVYGLAFIARPLGGIFFGVLGDKVGRRKVLSVTLLGIGGATAIIGLLPSYGKIGLWAPAALLICRLIQGFSAGGEAIGAPSFVLEHAPANKRGLWIGITIAMSALPSIFAGVLILGIASVIPAESYNSWGWRIPFLIAAPLSVIGLYIRNRTEESEAFKQVIASKKNAPTSTLLGKVSHNKIKMLQVFLIVSLNALTFYFMVGYFVTYLQTVVKLSQTQALFSNAVALLVFSILLPCGGFLSDKIGRKPMMITGSLLIVLLSFPAFWLLTSQTLLGAMAAQVLLAILLSIFGGGSYTFFVELFPTHSRFTGAAISYNLSYTIFGGAAPFVATWLIKLTNLPIAPAFCLGGVAFIVFLTALWVPETFRHDLNRN
ncbi:MFS transporter [Paramixta manurensis]|uniref:MFS transporter n=1 Tax=Paramixta manurensis TaxID=2740817 RepID=A0A6M8UL57_9GAMM|nr:MFS transporter [Erwiniaceae bacterium PD-1]